MFKFVILLSVLAAATAAATISKTEATNVAVKLVTSEELNALLKQYPNAKPLEISVAPETKVTGETRDTLQYTIGSRIYGDYLVSTDFGYNSWPTLQDVQFKVEYPAAGVGKIVTYFQILVDQTGRQGRAYVIAGGIGQRFISVVVEAYSTYVFNYKFYIYGY